MLVYTIKDRRGSYYTNQAVCDESGSHWDPAEGFVYQTRAAVMRSIREITDEKAEDLRIEVHQIGFPPTEVFQGDLFLMMDV